jgi:hypothetical protein
MLKGALVGVAAVNLAIADATSAHAQTGPAMHTSPYGGGPSTGLQFPLYCKPAESIRSRNSYLPGSETLGTDEIRIRSVGSPPFAGQVLLGQCAAQERPKQKRLPG